MPKQTPPKIIKNLLSHLTTSLITTLFILHSTETTLTNELLLGESETIFSVDPLLAISTAHHYPLHCFLMCLNVSNSYANLRTLFIVLNAPDPSLYWFLFRTVFCSPPSLHKHNYASGSSCTFLPAYDLDTVSQKRIHVPKWFLIILAVILVTAFSILFSKD